MGAPWSDFNRDAAAVEALELAIELFEARRSLALVVSVAHIGGQYFSDRVRPERSDANSKFELIDVFKEAWGDGFDEKWFRERAHDVANDLKHFDAQRNASPVVRISVESAAFIILCGILDCEKAIGRVTERMAEWRAAQSERARQLLLGTPEGIERAEKIEAAAISRGIKWRSKKDAI